MVKKVLKHTPLYRPLAQLYDWYNFNISYLKEVKRILFLPKNIHTFFIFPFYHTGGAELVHFNIVKAIQQPTVTFFTVPSANEHFLQQFQKHSDCHIIEKMIRKPWRKKLLLRLLARKINQQNRTSVFGCHSLFFYELLPYLHKDIKCIDLIHAFTHEDEPGFEKVSLPYVERLDKRVTISKKGKQDLIELYSKNQVEPVLADRIDFIYNATNFECHELPEKPKDVFNIVYVGRNSPEKRIPIIGQIATSLKQINPKFNIIMVGEDLENGVNPEDRSSCIFKGGISNSTDLESIYRSSHVVLITSTREGIPMALIEGMVFGAVPITTNVGGISELIEHDFSGKIIPFAASETEQKDLFLNEITQLKENPTLYNECSTNSYIMANEAFSEIPFCIAYNEILKQ